jgi:predicted permease
MVTRLYEDFRHAFRLILGNGTLSLAVLLSLTLGIGASSSMFGVVDSFLLRPISAPDSDRIVRITSVSKMSPVGGMSHPDFEDLQKRATVFETMASVRQRGAGISTHGESDSRFTLGLMASQGLFSMLQIRPALGRIVLPEEDEVFRRDFVAMISYELWQNDFDGSPDVLGKTIAVNRTPLKIIGVMPKGFKGVELMIHPQFYAPRMLEDSLDFLKNRSLRNLSVYGKLKSGVTLDQARAEIGGIAAQLEKEHPDTNRGQSMTVYTPVGYRVAEDPTFLFIAIFFFVIGGLVLAIACVNVSNLMLSTVPARTRETAVRLAMGASRMRLLRQFLIEGALLAGVSSAAGLGVATVVALLVNSVQINSGFLPFSVDMRVDTRVALFGLAVGLVAGALSALIPAIRCSRGNLDQLMRSSGPRVTRSKTRFRQALVSAQIAFATVVLLVSGLSLQDLKRLQLADPGFRVDNVFIMGFDPSLGRGFSLQETLRFYEQLLERVRRTPGVEAAGLGSNIPLGISNSAINVEIEGYEKPQDQDVLPILASSVSEGYFATLDIPVLKGRAFDSTDSSDGPRTIVINEAMASQYWPGKDPLGKQVKLLYSTTVTAEVVGIVRTTKFGDLEENPTPYFYLPVPQEGDTFQWLFVATKGSAEQVIPSLRNAVREVDPNQPIYSIRTMADTVRRDTLWGDRLATQIATGAGVVGLLLGVLGLYGILAYSVSERTREIGIRIAVGATKWHVYRMIVRQALTLCVAGIVVGTILAVFLLSLLPETVTGPSDDVALLVYVAVVALLVAVSLFSSYYPARRAANVDPNDCLRCE